MGGTSLPLSSRLSTAGRTRTDILWAEFVPGYEPGALSIKLQRPIEPPKAAA